MPASPTARCPTCNKTFPVEQAPAFPFCSARCRQIDLGRWLSEEHSLPIDPDPEADEVPEIWPEDRADEEAP